MSADFAVREGVLADAELISAWNCAMAFETEGKRLDPEVSLTGVRALVQNPSYGVYYLATVGEEVVGQLMVNLEWIPARNAFAWWVQSVYVRPEHRRRGYYRTLYSHVRELAKKEGAVALKLYVDGQNARAKEAYMRMGMRQTSAMPGLSDGE